MLERATQGSTGSRDRAVELNDSSERSWCWVSSPQPKRASGDPPDSKEGPGTQQKSGQGDLFAKKEVTDPSAGTRAQESKETTEIRGQEKRGKLLKDTA